MELSLPEPCFCLRTRGERNISRVVLGWDSKAASAFPTAKNETIALSRMLDFRSMEPRLCSLSLPSSPLPVIQQIRQTNIGFSGETESQLLDMEDPRDGRSALASVESSILDETCMVFRKGSHESHWLSTASFGMAA